MDPATPSESKIRISAIALCTLSRRDTYCIATRCVYLAFINDKFSRQRRECSNSRFNLNWGNAFNVRTTNAIGMHRFDVNRDGAAFGWLQ